MTEWFETWFGEEYLRLYPHRDVDDAERAIELVSRVARLEGARVLDLACGPGRHAVRLSQRGAVVVGFDLSLPLLSVAKHGTPPMERLVRGDMRILPFRPGVFDIVVNLFTSFGYFHDDDQHQRVIQEVATSLAPGGVFVIDYFNAEAVRRDLIPHETRAVGSQHVEINRSLTPDERFVTKEMHLVNDGRSFIERVRLYGADDLERLIGSAGLTVSDRFGDYDGRPPDADTPRTILVARRS